MPSDPTGVADVASDGSSSACPAVPGRPEEEALLKHERDERACQRRSSTPPGSSPTAAPHRAEWFFERAVHIHVERVPAGLHGMARCDDPKGDDAEPASVARMIVFVVV